MPTDTRCTSAVAAVIPISTGPGRKRVAKVSAMSCDLSPSSATKMTTKLSAAAARKSDKEHLPVRAGRKGAGRPRPGHVSTAKPKVSSAPVERTRDRPAGRLPRQYVDRDAQDYSPSRDSAYPVLEGVWLGWVA